MSRQSQLLSKQNAPWLSAPVDWATTAVGPISAWPQALLSALEVIRCACVPMAIAWGPRRAMFYNAVYAPYLSGKPEALGRPFEEVFPESWTTVADIFRRAEAGDGTFLEDFCVPLTRDGRTEDAWWSFSFSPLMSPSGGIDGVLLVVLETTRTVLAERREKKAAEELQRITDLVPSLLWRADSFGRTIWENGRLRTLAAANDADSASVWRKLVHPDDLVSVLAELATAKSDRRPFAKTFRLKAASGDYHLHQARSEPILDEKGQVLGWCGVATDIQNTRDAVLTLGERTALFGQFAANSANLLWTVDLETLEIERLSRNFEGVWPNLPTPWTWPDLLASIHTADRAAIQQGFTRVTHGEVVNGRFRVNTPAGDIRILEGTTFPIMSPEGRVTCLGGILKDVTPEVRRGVHLIEADAAGQNKLSHELRKAGFDVKAFRTVAEFARVATALAAAPILYRHRGDGEELARLSGLVRSTLPKTPWLVIQEAGQTSRNAIDMMKMGACDIVDADVSISGLSAALSTARSSMKSQPAVSVDRSKPATYRLTAREKEILDGIVAGGTNKSIALRLQLSPRTVESHRGRLMERLGVTSLAELVALASKPSFRCVID